jgi:hypothetical protein
MLDFLTKPVRGIGRMLRGNFREGIDDLGDGVKAASLPLSFINPLAGGAAALAGGVMDNAEEGIENMNFGKEALLPAAMSVGAGYAGRGIGKLLSGGGQMPGSASGILEGTPDLLPLQEGAGAVESLATKPITNTLPKAPGSGIGKMLSGVGNYVKENPLEVGSLALQPVGMMQPTAEEEMRDEERRRRKEWSSILVPRLAGR